MPWQIIPNDPALDKKPGKVIARTIAEDGNYPHWRVRLIPHMYTDGTVTGLRVQVEVKPTDHHYWTERQGNVPWALYRHLPALLIEFEQHYYLEDSVLRPPSSEVFGEGSVQELTSRVTAPRRRPSPMLSDSDDEEFDR